MKNICGLLLLALFTNCISVKADIHADSDHQPTDFEIAEAGIRLVMERQEIAWNNHDLEGFMQGYWKSDSLKFYGSNGLTKGWEQTLGNYKKGYPTKAESGTLNFVINDISKIEGDNYWVMGEYHLKREVGNADGVFIIIFKKINGEWKIVADMSC
ncbi:YybH family protein [Winogradskyella luteola]|uniref:Nuclear transport factor 2 family protein n=1 Tax=Winogradskyella luteola TaxID=2828330 RepID=A0A9X1F946_9FLAO|nr:nuclear transport factor 2 family protein [Winogradskyella luteola]MBV7269610.1 nuclear transport factor 2 family protein [Winogradskyella luteola]